MSGTLICGKTTGNAVVPVQVNTDGTLEMTAELDSSGLATKANQEKAVRGINNTGSIGDGNENWTSICLGYDRAGGAGRAVLVDANGRLSVDINSGVAIATIGSGGHASGAGVISCGLTSGSVAEALLVDSDGHLQVDIVNTANVKFEDISSSLNSGTANDPPNSLAVGLRARTTIGDSSTETFLLCDSDGHLQVEISEATSSPQTIFSGSQVIASGGSASHNFDTAGGGTILDVNGLTKVTYFIIGSGTAPSLSVSEMIGDTNTTLSVNASTSVFTSQSTFCISTDSIGQYRSISIANQSGSNTFTVTSIKAVYNE